jgi:hypothetical protein
VADYRHAVLRHCFDVAWPFCHSELVECLQNAQL